MASAMENAVTEESGVPLCVDLDGTLLLTDTLYESVILLLSKNPFYLFMLIIWLAGGRNRLKREISNRVKPDPSLLPYNEALLARLKQEKAAGRRLILVTAADQQVADSVAASTGLFEAAYGSDYQRNLKASDKARFLVEQFGEGGYDYVGDSMADIVVWSSARKCMVTGDESMALRVRSAGVSPTEVIERPSESLFKAVIKSMRLHQWLKNVLVFVPLVTSHGIMDMALLMKGVVAFFCFGLCASAIYIINDLCDLESDRKHPRKKERPFASGRVSLRFGLLFAPLLLLAGFGIGGALLPVQYLLTLAFYLVVTTAYTFRLKRVVLVDVMLLASLYTMRIIAGAHAMTIELSFWLLAFSMFIFLSLALMKRYTELKDAFDRDKKRLSGRGYVASDLPILLSMGIASGYMAVVVMALYINSPSMQVLYESPSYLWFLCVLFLYWVGRMWMQAIRSKMHDDPLVFAAKDRITHAVLILCAVFIALAASGVGELI